MSSYYTEKTEKSLFVAWKRLVALLPVFGGFQGLTADTRNCCTGGGGAPPRSLRRTVGPAHPAPSVSHRRPGPSPNFSPANHILPQISHYSETSQDPPGPKKLWIFLGKKLMSRQKKGLFSVTHQTILNLEVINRFPDQNLMSPTTRCMALTQPPQSPQYHFSISSAIFFNSSLSKIDAIYKYWKII